MSLSEIKEFQEAEIMDILNEDVEKELFSYGIDKHDVLHLEKKAIFNDPMQVICNNNIFSIGVKEAKSIEIKLVEKK